MAEGLATADGHALTLEPPDAAGTERAFAQAMAAAPDDSAAPPKRQPRAPAAEPPSRARSAKAGKASAKVTDRPALSEAEIITGVKGLCQVAAALPALASKRVREPKLQTALKADAIVIVSASDDIAQACADTAKADPKFAALMARICQAGPYAALMTVAFGVGSQIARNHGVASLPGTTDPADIVKMAEGNAPAVTGAGNASA